MEPLGLIITNYILYKRGLLFFFKLLISTQEKHANCIFSYNPKSSLKHDYLRARANPPP